MRAYADRTDPQSASQVVRRCAPLFDPLCGVLGNCTPLIFRPEYEGEVYGYSVSLGRVSVLHPAGRVSDVGALAGHGTGYDRAVAEVRAVCEALERYCSVMYPLDGVVATERELGSAAICGNRWPSCSSEEKIFGGPDNRLRDPDSNARDIWVEAYSLTRDRTVMVPMSTVYLGLPIPLSAHAVFPHSSGFAAGSSYADAVTAGLLELIERDSLMLWWLHQLPFPRLALSSFDGEGASVVLELETRARDRGVRSDFFDLSTDIDIPVVGLIQRSKHKPHVVMLGASRTSRTAAALRSLEEACSLRVVLGWHPGVDADRVISGDPRPPEEFGVQYAGDKDAAAFQFALEAPLTSMRRDPPDGIGLDFLLERMADLGMEVIVADVTLPEVRDCGLVVVRVLVPELQPISFSHAIRYLAHPRLFDAPARLGYGRRREAEVTRKPIPYA